tara:strand:+ start:5728 stop:6042 length:315 start_codon:yes stop_codon:yes gene_type:complete
MKSMLHLSLVFLISLQIVGLQLGDFSFNSESKYIKAQQLVVASFQKSNSEIHRQSPEEADSKLDSFQETSFTLKLICSKNLNEAFESLKNKTTGKRASGLSPPV